MRIGDRYDPQVLRQMASEIEALQRDKYGRPQDVVIGSPDALQAQGQRQQRLILVAPEGRRWWVQVDNDGNLSTVLL